MGTLTHPLVDDRVISGEGTPKFRWLEAFKNHPLDWLNLQLFQSKRVVIVAPHPDDEVLGCGGLMQQLIKKIVTLLLWLSVMERKAIRTQQNTVQTN